MFTKGLKCDIIRMLVKRKKFFMEGENMKKALKQKIMLSTLLIIMIITLLQGFSFAKSESTQMIKKGEKEYIIYISNLLNSKFEFAFANKKDEIEANLNFYDSAVDASENGNNIAYVDENIYNTYFDGKAETFLWIKGTEIKAEKIELSNALTEETIQDLNKVTKKIAIKIGNETKTEKMMKEQKLPIQKVL